MGGITLTDAYLSVAFLFAVTSMLFDLVYANKNLYSNEEQVNSAGTVCMPEAWALKHIFVFGCSVS